MIQHPQGHTPQGDTPPGSPDMLVPVPWNAVGARGPLTDPPTLAELTTLGIGGPVRDLVDVDTSAEMVRVVRDADARGVPVLVLGGGSNVIASDAPFDGVVVRNVHADVHLAERGPDGSVEVRASAGTGWDPFVCRTLEAGLSGLEALSGVPGTVGAAPVQNVGAYGREVGEVLVSVDAWDRAAGELVRLDARDLGLGYRTSVIKESLHGGDPDRLWGPTGRWVVLEVTLRLEVSPRSAPVRYTELARRLGVEVGGRASALGVREAVLALRRSKGMVLDPADHDTWSAGSFFTNPILPVEEADRLPSDAPRFPVGAEWVKTSAAWLISHAGFPRGWSLGTAASLSTRHVLALTNRGGATSADVEALARAVRDGVRERFGVVLVPEPVGLGFRL